jgi:hypothetical protein
MVNKVIDNRKQSVFHMVNSSDLIVTIMQVANRRKIILGLHSDGHWVREPAAETGPPNGAERRRRRRNGLSENRAGDVAVTVRLEAQSVGDTLGNHSQSLLHDEKAERLR